MKLSEENQKWLENKSYHSKLLNGYSVLNEDIEGKLLEMQQRIDELEKAKTSTNEIMSMMLREIPRTLGDFNKKLFLDDLQLDFDELNKESK